jgi:hypothetical protein
MGGRSQARFFVGVISLEFSSLPNCQDEGDPSRADEQKDREPENEESGDG